MNVLITGISGFLGFNLVRSFNKINEVKIFGLSSTLKGNNYQFVEKIYSYEELDDFNQFDVVIHLAGIAHDIGGNYNDSDYDRVNVNLTKQIFEKFVNSSATKFIFLSSSKVYGDNLKDICEDAQLSPVSKYAKTKVECEKWLEENKKEKKIYVLRPAMIHGEGGRGNLNLLNKLLSNLLFNPFASIHNSRSFLCVENFCFLIQEIIKDNVIPGTYNVADYKPLSLSRVTTILSDKKRLRIPKSLFKLISTFFEVLNISIFNRSVFNKLMGDFVISTKKLELQGVFFPYSSEEGMMNSRNSFKKVKQNCKLLEIPSSFEYLVSIITPVYNSGLFLDEMIQSVISQSITNWELLLVDDFSSDNSISIIEKYTNKYPNINLIKNSKNIGPGLSRNKAIKKAKGRYIAFLDSDDIWKKDKLSIQLSFMQKNNISFSHASYGYMDEESNISNKIFRVSSFPITYKNLLKKTEISCLTAIFDVSLIGKQYMPDLRQAEDYSLWLKILGNGIVSYPIKDVLAYYRQRKGSVTNRKISLIFKHWHFLYHNQGLSFIVSIYYLFLWGFNGLRKYYIS